MLRGCPTRRNRGGGRREVVRYDEATVRPVRRVTAGCCRRDRRLLAFALVTPTPAAEVDDAQPPAATIAGPGIIYALLFASVGAYFPYITLFYRETGLSLEAVGLVVAVSAAVGLVAAPAWGAFGDRSVDLRGPLVLAGAVATCAAI